MPFGVLLKMPAWIADIRADLQLGVIQASRTGWEADGFRGSFMSSMFVRCNYVRKEPWRNLDRIKIDEVSY